MGKNFQRIAYVLILIVVIITNIQTFQTFTVNEKDSDRFISLALKVCHNTVQLSKQASFLIADFNSDPSVPVLIQSLHISSISIILTTHHCKFLDFMNEPQVRNFIIFLDNVEEVLSLILSSASRETRWREDCDFNMKHENSISAVRCFENRESCVLSKLPRYCVSVDKSQRTADKICDEQLFISSEELNGDYVLSDHNFNMTRGLYTNPIWNSNNYLIFMLRDFDQDDCKPPTQHHAMISPNETASNDSDELILCFKFIWRFFRGVKTTICSEKGCSRYDYFAENIIWYSGEDHEVYFDFSVTNMHRKHLSFLLDDAEGAFVADNHFQSWMLTVRGEIIDAVAESINGTSTFYFGFTNEEIGHEVGQKLSVDLHLVEVGATTQEIDYSRFDFSVGFETEAMCILTPHSELIPQCLVPFKVFSFPVWIFIGITVIVFVLMQYVFLQAQGGSFRNLYSETDISLYDSTSAAHTIYAYFICGRPPRLLLGKLFTGKILFIIFIFSALIISSVFLGGMTTLLTNTVQYPEINTLKDLEDSDLLIQVPDTKAADLYFAQLGLSEKLRGKLACSLALYLNVIDGEVGQLSRSQTPAGFKILLWRDHVPEKFVKNVHVIMESDAFVATLQASLSSGTRVVLRKWLFPEKIEYHLVSERLKVRPYFQSFLKNSFLFEKFNAKLAQFLESGHVSKAYDSDLPDAPEAAPPPPKEEDPKPYSLNDLQLPFFSLLLGLFSSLLVFIAEMVMEDFENVFVFRQLRRFKNFLTKKND